MKLIKYLAFAFAGMLAFAGCSDDDTYNAASISGQQIYFSDTQNVELYVDQSKSAVYIDIARVVADKAYTAPIVSTDDSKIFTIPSTVTFAEGVKKTQIKIEFDYSKLTDDSYPISLLIYDPENTTPYGESRLDLSIAPWPWIEFEENESWGLYRDDYFTGVWGGTNVEIPVKIFKHKTKEGEYMVQDMFGWTFLEAFFGMPRSSVEAGYASYQSKNFTFKIDKDGKVSFPLQETGIIDPDYGMLSIGLFVDCYGSIKDGVITFGKSEMAVAVGNQPMAYANASGLFRIVMPGYDVKDYSMSVAYGGMVAGADNVATAYFTMNYTADVTGIAYMFLPGDREYDLYPELLEQSFGSAEELDNIVDPFVQGGKSVTIEAQLPQGVYTLLAIPMDKNGDLAYANYATTQFYYHNVDTEALPECEIEIEFMKPSEAEAYIIPEIDGISFEQLIGAYSDLNYVVYVIKSTEDIKTLAMFQDEKAEIDPYYQYGYSIDALYEAFSSDISSWAVPQIRSRGYALNIIPYLDPGKEYTGAVGGSNVYGKSTLAKIDFATPAAPEHADGVVTGEYVIIEELQYEDGSTEIVPSTFTVFGSDYPQLYTVNDLLFDSDPKFYAMYDAANSTFTLDGTAMNMGYGETNLFNNGVLGYVSIAVSEEEVMDFAYSYISFADPEGETADDPMVFTVDPVTRKINGLTTYVEVPLYYGSQFVGSLIGYSPAAVIMTMADYETVNTPSEPAPAQLNVASKRVPFMSLGNIPSTAMRFDAPSKAENLNLLNRTAFEDKTLRGVDIRNRVVDGVATDGKFERKVSGKVTKILAK